MEPRLRRTPACVVRRGRCPCEEFRAAQRRRAGHPARRPLPPRGAPRRRPDGTTYWRAHDELLDRAGRACACCRRDAAAPSGSSAPPARPPPSPTRGSCGSSTPARPTASSTSSASGSPPAASPTCSPTARCRPAEARDLAHRDRRRARRRPPGRAWRTSACSPEHVLRTSHGQIKVAGLAVDAAVRGLTAADAADAARRDTRGRGGDPLRRADRPLAGREPAPAWPPPRTTATGVCSPRQVRAGVPDDLDDIVSRALGLARHRHAASRCAPRPSSPGADRGHATSRVPVVAPAGRPRRTAPPYPPSRSRRTTTRPAAAEPRGRLAWAAGRPGAASSGSALAGCQLVLTRAGRRRPRRRDDTARPRTATATSGRDRQPAAASRRSLSFDPPPDGNGEENADRADRVVDGDRRRCGTRRSTSTSSARPGSRRASGWCSTSARAKTVGSVTVSSARAPTSRCASRTSGRRAGRLHRGRQAVDAVGRAVVVPAEPLRARYVLSGSPSLPADGALPRPDRARSASAAEPMHRRA